MTSTVNYGLYQPLVNSPTDSDLWGSQLNTDLVSIDSVLYTAMNLTATAATNTITVTAATAGSTTTGSSNLLYNCNATGGAFAANLPAAASATNMMVVFRKTDASANAVTITGHAAELINGSNTYSLAGQYAYLIIVCDGTGWDIISQTAPTVSIATSLTAGIVIPDGTVITVSGTGAITVPQATSSAFGVVKSTMTALGVGSIILAQCSTGIGAGSSTAAGNLTALYPTAVSFDTGHAINLTPSGDSLSGTWRALVTQGGAQAANATIFQRIA